MVAVLALGVVILRIDSRGTLDESRLHIRECVDDAHADSQLVEGLKVEHQCEFAARRTLIETRTEVAAVCTDCLHEILQEGVRHMLTEEHSERWSIVEGAAISSVAELIACRAANESRCARCLHLHSASDEHCCMELVDSIFFFSFERVELQARCSSTR